MRRKLLLACAVALLGSLAVAALAADAPESDERTGAKEPSVAAPPRDSGPFALAESGVSEASDDEDVAERSRSYDRDFGSGVHIRRSRVQIMGEVADRLGVTRPRMWRALADVRRQISPRSWSDARDEGLTLLAVELDRSPRRVRRIVQDELSDRYDHGDWNR